MQDLSGEGGSRGDGDQLPDAPYALLADERRRHCLRCLADREDPMGLADLAREVAARERDAPVADVPTASVQRVHVDLYHVHVPKLAAENVVLFDRERNAVSLADDDE